jgi:hypothetical protein
LKTIASRDSIPLFLKNLNLLRNYIELGVSSGEGLLLWNKFKPKQLYGVDLWEDDGVVTDKMSLPRIKQNYESSFKIMLDNPNIKLLKGYTQNFAPMFPNEFFDFVFIDDDHSYIATKVSLHTWWKKVKTGGVLAGHDYFNGQASYKFGVIQAVTEFRNELNIPGDDFSVTLDSPPSFIIRKT